MAYTAIDDAGSNFNTVIWTGADNTLTRSFTGVGFQPDAIWAKSRSAVRDQVFSDAVRGVENNLSPNTTGAADTGASNAITSFDSDGWTMGSDGLWNADTETFVAWNWKANGTGSANTDGTGLASVTVSANTTAGFSICTYTSTGTAGDSFGHGLSQAPELVIVKVLGVADDWIIGSTAGTAAYTMDFTYYLRLNSTIARTGPYSAYWDDTNPTSSVVTVGTNGGTNQGGTTREYIAYCFHSVEGYSKVGSYTGNGNADGTFVYTGFRPAYILAKDTSSANNWAVVDDARNTYNVSDARLTPNSNVAESTSLNCFDFVSNGFKVRTNDADLNSNTYNYLYYAVAESPFKTANAR